jgi:hypothetical protein
MLGQHFLRSAQPILRHVEYAGLIPRLERLAATFEGNDLVLVESRGASDVHVLALPLAYIYARNVLVLATTDPDKALFREFLAWTRDRYGRVFFVGGGGTELLSRTMAVRAVGGERFQVPEYQSPRNAYPRGLTQKEFDFGVYEILRDAVEPENFDLDVGTADDLYVRRFHAKEQHPNGFTFRWTRDVSFVSIVGSRQGCRRLTLWMSNGGRPAAAEVAEVTVHLNDRAIGSATVGVGLDPYRFLLPPDLADQIAGAEDAAQLRIESSTWSPRQFIGNNDDRMLGVNVDRVAIDCGDDPHRP